MKVLSKTLRKMFIFTSYCLAGLCACYIAIILAVCMYGSYAEKIASM